MECKTATLNMKFTNSVNQVSNYVSLYFNLKKHESLLRVLIKKHET